MLFIIINNILWPDNIHIYVIFYGILLMLHQTEWKNSESKVTPDSQIFKWFYSISFFYYFPAMIFPVFSSFLAFLTEDVLSKSPASTSLRTDQPIYRGINAGCYVAVPSSDPFSEARAPHWLMDTE